MAIIATIVVFVVLAVALMLHADQNRVPPHTTVDGAKQDQAFRDCDGPDNTNSPGAIYVNGCP